jgi:hypothetical protein
LLLLQRGEGGFALVQARQGDRIKTLPADRRAAAIVVDGRVRLRNHARVLAQFVQQVRGQGPRIGNAVLQLAPVAREASIDGARLVIEADAQRVHQPRHGRHVAIDETQRFDLVLVGAVAIARGDEALILDFPAFGRGLVVIGVEEQHVVFPGQDRAPVHLRPRHAPGLQHHRGVQLAGLGAEVELQRRGFGAEPHGGQFLPRPQTVLQAAFGLERRGAAGTDRAEVAERGVDAGVRGAAAQPQVQALQLRVAQLAVEGIAQEPEPARGFQVHVLEPDGAGFVHVVVGMEHEVLRDDVAIPFQRGALCSCSRCRRTRSAGRGR